MAKQNTKPKTMSSMQITILEQTKKEGIKMENQDTKPSQEQTAITKTTQETKEQDTKEILSPIKSGCGYYPTHSQAPPSH